MELWPAKPLFSPFPASFPRSYETERSVLPPSGFSVVWQGHDAASSDMKMFLPQKFSQGNTPKLSHGGGILPDQERASPHPQEKAAHSLQQAHRKKKARSSWEQAEVCQAGVPALVPHSLLRTRTRSSPGVALLTSGFCVGPGRLSCGGSALLGAWQSQSHPIPLSVPCPQRRWLLLNCSSLSPRHTYCPTSRTCSQVASY